MNPRVSVITITFNAESYLERTIESVITQDLEALEFIIVDGLSTDSTLDIIKTHHSEIDQWISEKDSGIYDAMNKGLKMAKGEYVVFMNAGDRFANPQSLSRAMEEGENSDFIYGRTLRVDELGNKKPWHKRTPSEKELSFKSFQNGMVICHQAMIVKRDIAPLYESSKWKISGDIDWAIRVLKQTNQIHFYDDVFCHYLEGGVSITNKWGAVLERFRLSVYHFGFLPTIITQIQLFIHYFAGKSRSDV